jgi:hypothetical protein
MFLKAIKETFSSLARNPSLLITGVYGGIITSLFVWLELIGNSFIAQKVSFIALVFFPFFMGALNHTLSSGDSSFRSFFTGGCKAYFPILLPIIILIGIIVLIVILFTIPLSIMGFGNDMYALSGLLIGIMVPVIIFSWYTDNVAVCEKLSVIPTLKRSMELCSREFISTLGCIVISGMLLLISAFIGAFIWGMILADRFTPYLEMNMTAQREIFSNYTYTDWQAFLGPDGALVSAFVFGLVAFIFIPFFLVYKYQCYSGISNKTVVIAGEFDEKGRWYKY